MPPKRELIWSEKADADLAAIIAYIGEENPRAAIALDQYIQFRVEQLFHFPMSGRPGRQAGTRELVIA